MTTFNHGDRVISVTQKDVTIEAQVDFETPDGKVYISEWGKNLNNPIRIVLDKKYLVKKEKKVILNKAEFQRLIFEYYPTPVNVDELDKEIVLTDGYTFRYDDRYNLEYVAPYQSGRYIFREVNTTPKENRDDRYYIINDNELQQNVVKKTDVLNYLFGNGDDAVYDIVLDDNENANEENI